MYCDLHVAPDVAIKRYSADCSFRFVQYQIYLIHNERNFRGGSAVRTPTFRSGGWTPHFISTPSKKFCLVLTFQTKVTPLLFTQGTMVGKAVNSLLFI